ncbi:MULTISPECIES: hypothetical protein [Pontibacillus]|uniref:Uncharacterized protein n=1 Tax=Pontibacillus chungwhensis TaxID=265426 RepID=A0ABY8US79_9BACI|nr:MULTISPECIES: hypothetical protein [Pontibacillus]MCD5323143.1 hypothetical protein [Pontibacillus sp. HN14]WIF96531.1 hypothetical protein QNI29_12295 [Pontibacillus chungwhensis]
MMSNKNKQGKKQGSQKGKPFSDALTAQDNVMSKEEMKKATHPTQTTIDED